MCLTDDTGMLQHAVYTLPNYEHGYCTDDNARALILMMLLEELKNAFRKDATEQHLCSFSSQCL